MLQSQPVPMWLHPGNTRVDENYLFNVYDCFVYIYACVPCTGLVLEETRRGHWTPRDKN